MTHLHTLLVMLGAGCFILFVLKTISTHVLRIKDALLWLGIGALGLASPLFYSLAEWLCKKLGFPTPSIQLLCGAIFLLCLLLFQLSVAVSRGFRERSRLAQEIALLNHKINSLEKPDRKK